MRRSTTGASCARASKNFLLDRASPRCSAALILTAVFVKSCVDLSDPANSESGDSWFGLGPPLVIGVGFLVFGAVLMVIWYLAGHREFFRRKTEVASPEILAHSPAGRSEA